MSNDTQANILETVEAVLAGKELMDQPRAILLFRLCQISMLMNLGDTEKYWSKLQPLLNKVPSDLQSEAAALRIVLEETATAGAKGFTAEMLSAIDAARALDDPEDTKRQLLEVEAQVKKRFLPFGKGPVWNALVEAWIPVDRSYALQLLKNVSSNLQENFILRMNKAERFSVEEWNILVSSVGMPKVVQMALKILDDESQDLSLPKEALQQAAKQIRDALEQFGNARNETDVVKKFNLYRRLLAIHTNSDQAGFLPFLLEDLFDLIVKTQALEQMWPTRFLLVKGIIDIGVQLETQNVPVLTNNFRERLRSKTPAYMVDYFYATWDGKTAPPEEIEQIYKSLMIKVKGNENAEAWFLVTLVERGLAKDAFELAAKLPRASTLLPRLRRAWMSNNPQTAMHAIKPEEMLGDPIGEFLVLGSVEGWVAYLKSATQNGARSIPGGMWAASDTQDIIEYTRRNPVYSSYQIVAKKEDQFSEVLRLNGYGEYNYKDIDGALLVSLVNWGDQDPQSASSALRNMWSAIRPNDAILMVDWLRTAIITRCNNVLAADPDVLINDYLMWVKRELVEKGRQWQLGNQIMTLRFPAAALFSFCVSAAVSVAKYSTDRKDRILLSGLLKFEATPEMVEVAAQLYNSEKAPLELEPPLKLKSNQLPAWQTGIVKNAVPEIIKALIARAQANASQNMAAA